MVTPRSALMSTFGPAVLLFKLKPWATKVTRISQTIKNLSTKNHCWRPRHKKYNLCTALSSDHRCQSLSLDPRLYSNDNPKRLAQYLGTLMPEVRELDSSKSILEDARPINPKYFKPETWVNHIKHSLGQQQFAKFVSVMAERIWMQTSTADEIRAFTKLLSDEQEWNFLSVGVATLNKYGVYDHKGPQVPQHFQSCLLWHQIDEVIAVRQEQIQQQLPAERTAAVPYENRIHLRKEDTLVSNLFGSSTQGTHSKQIERCKQSFEDFAQLRAPDLDRSPKESINGTPDRVAVIALREAPHIVMTSKAVNIQDIVGKIEASRRRGCTGCHHGYLTSEHPSYRPIELNSGRPRRPNPPDIPERIHLFDATGMPKPNTRNPTSYTPAYAVQETSPVQEHPRNPAIMNGNNARQQPRLILSNQQRDSSSSNTQPLNTKSPKPRISRPPPRSLRAPNKPHYIQQAPRQSPKQQSRPSVRFVEGTALTTVAEFSSDEAPSAIPANDNQKPQTEPNVSVRSLDTDEEEDDENADCPPAYLLVELGSKIVDVKIGERLGSEVEETTRRKEPTAV